MRSFDKARRNMKYCELLSNEIYGEISVCAKIDKLLPIVNIYHPRIKQTNYLAILPTI